jgi:hypothetical protein
MTERPKMRVTPPPTSEPVSAYSCPCPRSG